MKNLSTTIILAFAIAMIISSCNPKEKKTNINMTNTETEAKTPGFIHAVYFWLKKDNPELLKEFKEKGLPKLATVSSIQSVHWGPPAGTPRDVVDNSYDMSWIVTFDNAAEQDKYQVDPIHLEFVKLYESLFERVQVYDSNITNSK